MFKASHPEIKVTFSAVVNGVNRDHNVSRDSSVSIVSVYGLDDRAIEVRSLAEAKRFFL
jgi:hypothetical protein